MLPECFEKSGGFSISVAASKNLHIQISFTGRRRNDYGEEVSPGDRPTCAGNMKLVPETVDLFPGTPLVFALIKLNSIQNA